MVVTVWSLMNIQMERRELDHAEPEWVPWALVYCRVLFYRYN